MRVPQLRAADWSAPRLNALVWFGVLGGPVAWATQFLFGMQIGLARCESPDARFQFPVSTVAIALAATAVFIGVLAELAGVVVLRATRDEQVKAQIGRTVSADRLHFLAAVAVTVNPLALTICALVGIGVPLLGGCHQS